MVLLMSGQLKESVAGVDFQSTTTESEEKERERPGRAESINNAHCMDEDVHRVNTVKLHKQCGMAMTADKAEMSTPLPQWQEQWTHREGLPQNPTAPQLEWQ